MSSPKLIDNQADTLEREALDGLRAVVARLDRLRETGPRTGKLMERVDRAFTATRAALHDWEDATDERHPPRDPGTPPDLA